MTRKNAVRYEREFKAYGVYKPYVSTEGDTIVVESYPLTARLVQGFDRELGPITTINVKDYSLTRLGADSLVATLVLQLGQLWTQHLGKVLAELHTVAYARAIEQDSKYSTER